MDEHCPHCGGTFGDDELVKRNVSRLVPVECCPDCDHVLHIPPFSPHLHTVAAETMNAIVAAGFSRIMSMDTPDVEIEDGDRGNRKITITFNAKLGGWT